MCPVSECLLVVDVCNNCRLCILCNGGPCLEVESSKEASLEGGCVASLVLPGKFTVDQTTTIVLPGKENDLEEARAVGP